MRFDGRARAAEHARLQNSRSSRGLTIGVHQPMFDLPPHTGHGRVWTKTLAELGQMADLTVGRLDPDVWLIDGHNGDPGYPGPTVSVVYEVGWGVPDLDRENTPQFIKRMSEGTRGAVERSDHVITGSHASKRDIMINFDIPSHRVHVIPFGVDSTTFRPDADPIPGLPFDPDNTDAPYVLFASTLHPRKNLAAVRAAIQHLGKGNYPHRLVLVVSPFGDREDNDDLLRSATAELEGLPGRVVRVEDPSDQGLAYLMSRAAALCQPSKHEGFGLTVLEAMAAGAPVVVSNRASLPELVDGVGWVVEPTAEGVEKALREIFDDPQAADRARLLGRRRAMRLSWERTARGWLGVAALAAAAARPLR